MDDLKNPVDAVVDVTSSSRYRRRVAVLLQCDEDVASTIKPGSLHRILRSEENPDTAKAVGGGCGGFQILDHDPLPVGVDEAVAPSK